MEKGEQRPPSPILLPAPNRSRHPVQNFPLLASVFVGDCVRAAAEHNAVDDKVGLQDHTSCLCAGWLDRRLPSSDRSAKSIQDLFTDPFSNALTKRLKRGPM